MLISSHSVHAVAWFRATHVARGNAVQTFAQINKFSNLLAQQKYVLFAYVAVCCCLCCYLNRGREAGSGRGIGHSCLHGRILWSSRKCYKQLCFSLVNNSTQVRTLTLFCCMELRHANLICQRLQANRIVIVSFPKLTHKHTHTLKI